MRMKPTTGWAIVGHIGLYTGWWLTRSAAVGEHVSLKTGVGTHNHSRQRLSPEQAAEWKKCRAQGDRVVKIRITEIK